MKIIENNWFVNLFSVIFVCYFEINKIRKFGNITNILQTRIFIIIWFFFLKFSIIFEKKIIFSKKYWNFNEKINICVILFIFCHNIIYNKFLKYKNFQDNMIFFLKFSIIFEKKSFFKWNFEISLKKWLIFAIL